jgi:hypothetical protein
MAIRKEQWLTGGFGCDWMSVGLWKVDFGKFEVLGQFINRHGLWENSIKTLCPSG